MIQYQQQTKQQLLAINNNTNKEKTELLTTIYSHCTWPYLWEIKRGWTFQEVADPMHNIPKMVSKGFILI